MNMKEYQDLAGRTINRLLSEKELIDHAVLGMASEVGEIAGIFQKVYQGHDYDPVDLGKEIGDVLWFVAELCTAMGFDLDRVAELNIDKLRKRYPDGFDAEKSLHRAEGDT